MQNTQSYIQQEPSKHLSEYYFILLKHKWVIIAVCLIAVSLSVYRNSGLIPMYKTTATIIIEGDRRTSPITGQRMNYESFYLGTLTFNTHLKLITSRPVLERVIKKLKFDQINNEDLRKKKPGKTILSTLKQNFNLLVGKKTKPSIVIDKMAQQAASLKGKITIEHVEDTRLLKITATDLDPIHAKNIANALAKSYIDFNIENSIN